MKILIDTINKETFKALAKAHLKRIKKKDPTTTQTLMSIQEDLARVLGHKNLHAAQGYWDRQALAEEISEPLDNPHEHASDAELLQTTTAVRSAVTYLSETAYAFSCASLQKVSMQFMGEQASDNPEKWSALTAALIEAPLDDLVKLDNKGNMTTLALEKKRKNMIELSKDCNANRGIAKMEVEEVLSEYQALLPPKYQVQMTEVCLSHTRLNLVQALPGTHKSAAMLCLKKAYEKSGFHVETIALSCNDSKMANAIMGTHGEGHMGNMIEKLDRYDDAPKPLFDQPTLIVVDSANGVMLPMLESFLRKVAEQPKQIKVVMFYRPGTSPSYSTLNLLSAELRVVSLTPNNEARIRTNTPFDVKLNEQIEGLAIYANVFSNSGLTLDQMLEEIRPGLAKIATAAVRGLEGDTPEHTFKKRCHQIYDAFSSPGAPLSVLNETPSEPGRVKMPIELKQSLVQEIMSAGAINTHCRDLMIEIFSCVCENQADWGFPEQFVVDWKALSVVSSPQPSPTRRPK